MVSDKYKHLYDSVLTEYEALSTCSRLHVAALLVKDGRILSVGYNGVPAGRCHCNFLFQHDEHNYQVREDTSVDEVQEPLPLRRDPISGEWVPNKWRQVTADEFARLHHEFSEKHEIHAEMNCLAFALKNQINLSGCAMILSVSPCINCAKLIVSAGIKEVIYRTKYDRSDEGIKFLEANDVMVISWNTKIN